MVVLVTVVVAVAIAIVLSVRVFESKFAFFPIAGEDVTPRNFGVRFDATTVVTADGERLHAWILPAPAPRAVVVYFHGNGGNLSVWAPILAGVQQHGFTVVALDYRGYGKSTGHPSERGLYRDVEAVLERVWETRPPALPIIYWGRSLGTTMAAYAATVHAPSGVILEAGFPDARALLRATPPLGYAALLSTYRFPTASFMQRVASPALVLHGDADSVVPYALGRALFDRIPGPKQFVTVRGGDHNDVEPADARTYWSAIDDFVSRL